MKLQEDIIRLLEEKETEHPNLLIDYITDIEDSRVSSRNANERLMNQVERIVLEENSNDY